MNKASEYTTAFAVILVLFAGKLQATAEGVDIEPRHGHRLPASLAFADRHGAAVTLGDYLNDGPVLLTPVWFQCQKMCGYTLTELAKTLSMLKGHRDTPVIAVSIDPRETGADALEQQRLIEKRFPSLDVERRWHLLTGSDKTINALSEHTGFRFRYSEALRQYLHPVATLVLSPDGSISSYLYGAAHQPEKLKTSLEHAAARRVNPHADSLLLLLCYRYDDSTGRYTVSIMKVLRLAGVISIALLAGFIVYSHRREKHERR